MYNYIVDSHCHLNLIEDKGYKISDLLENAAKSNVKIINNICTDIDNYDKIKCYKSNADVNIYRTIGDHPCTINNERLPKNKNDIINFINNDPDIIGIGETGLDYYHDKNFIELQKKSFINHIMAACDSELPVVIHNRESDDDMIDILKYYKDSNSNLKLLLHCFSSSKKLADFAINMGIYISISGIVTFKNASLLKEIVKDIPLDLLLVETDSPYLSPTPLRGQINQPCNTKYVVDYIAMLKNVSRETIISETTRNFHNLFLRAKNYEA